MNEKRFVRSNDKMLAGVAAGIANYLGLDPMLARLAFVLFSLLGGAGGLVYLVLWIIMPKE